MKDQHKTEWAALMQEGVQGRASRFRLRAMRLAQALRNSDPEMSRVLVQGLGAMGEVARFHKPILGNAIAPQSLIIESEVVLDVKPCWPQPVESHLQQIILEWKKRETLVNAGLAPIKTSLFVGPPGVGKTLAARWLANQLGLPLATLDLAATMNSYFGKTGQNIASALEYSNSNACVLFLDEFDALAKHRNDDQDVGELKRVVNVLLQTIDQWNGPSLLVAATNHFELIDSALVRRFEKCIDFPPSTRHQLKLILKSLGVSTKLAADLSIKLEGRPISDATRIVNSARKRSVLENVSFDTATNIAVEEIKTNASPVQKRKTLALKMANEGMSSHQIAKQLNISHTTVLRDLKSIC